MPLTPEQLEQFDRIIDTDTAIIATATTNQEATIALRDELAAEDPVDPPVEPVEPVDPPPTNPDVYPPGTNNWADDATRTAKVAWIKAHTGAGNEGELRVVASAADLTKYKLPGSWSNGGWICPSCPGTFEHLDVRGLLYYAGDQTLKLRDVACRGVQYKSASKSPGGTFDWVTVRKNPLVAAGQGAINFFGQMGWTVRNCELSGFADGMQCIGPGVIDTIWVHDFLFTDTTHNDGCQHYGPGNVDVYRGVYEMGTDPKAMNNHSNGALFCSRPTARFTAAELYVMTVPTSQANVNALNAYGAPVGSITVSSGYISGGHLSSQIPGAIKLLKDVVRV